MSINENLEVIVEKRWQNSFFNLMSIEFLGWWKSRTWLVMTLIWVAIINGIIIMLLLSAPDIDISSAISLYGLFGGLFPPIAVILIMQDSIIGEKKSGTAEWVLSKPVSRKSFILAKWMGNSLNVFITIGLLPGIINYVMFSLIYGQWLFFPSFLLGIVLLSLNLIFFVTLTLMFGTYLDSAGAVAAIPIAFNFMQQFLVSIPFVKFILPQYLYFIPDETSIMTSVILGLPIPSIIPIISVIVFITAFLLIAMLKFEKAEF